MPGQKSKRSGKSGGLAAVLLLLFLAAIVRVSALDRRTIHIDEGMGIRASQLALEGQWRYYPANGHGPTLFYAGALVRVLAGSGIVAARALTVFFGMGTIVLLCFFLRKKVGNEALLFSGFLLAFSSGMVFFHVYFIHESLLVFFTVAALLCGWGWVEHRSVPALTALPVFLALMYATKETAILTVAAWTIAGGILLLFVPETRKHVRDIPLAPLSIGLFLAVLLHVLLFSSLFANPRGIGDSVVAPFHWLDRARTFHHRPFHYFFLLLSIREFALIVTSLLFTALLFVLRRWNATTAFLWIASLSLLLIYSMIAYKTPWCVPTMIVFLTLFCAFSLHRVFPVIREKYRAGIGGLLLILSVGMFFRMIEDNFGHPDRIGSYDYAYLQSGDSLRTFMHVLKDLSRIHGGGDRMPLQVIGEGDELLHVITDRYAREYGAFHAGYPVYVNYQHSADELRDVLDETGSVYIRSVYTYIQGSVQVDLFVESSLWEAYRHSPIFPMPHVATSAFFDYR